MREARESYFRRSGFGIETYTDRWVHFSVGRFTCLFPNVQARKICVPLHDINHVLTGYLTDWKGECEIASYEYGTGMGQYWFAWWINAQGLLLGFLICPLRCIRAFSRGVRSGSVYRGFVVKELLDRSVESLKEELSVSQDCSLTPQTISLFIVLWLSLLFLNFLPLILFGGLIAQLID